jgi:hypothetical protein
LAAPSAQQIHFTRHLEAKAEPGSRNVEFYGIFPIDLNTAFYTGEFSHDNRGRRRHQIFFNLPQRALTQ